MHGLRLGYSPNGFAEVMRYDVKRNGQKRPGEMHAVLVAPTRAGKGTDILVPALLEWGSSGRDTPMSEASSVVIDIKGQLCSLTAAERARRGQRIVILNPFGIWPEYIGPQAAQFAHVRDRVFNAGFNPMAALVPESESFGSDADTLAEAIVWQESGQESHWNDSARQLVSGLIMQLAATGARANLNEVRAALCSSEKLLQVAREAGEGEDDFTKEKLSRYTVDPGVNREIGSIISTAMTQTGFIGSRAIGKSLATSDFRFRDLRKQPTTVYIILPTRHLASCGKWFRLLIASALNDLLTEDERGLPVLMVLDEFAQLGYLKLIEDAMALAAGYGVQMLCVLQDLNQLKKNYKENFETFIANAGISLWYAPRDITTSEYVSKQCGQKWEYLLSRNVSEQPLLADSRLAEQSLSVTQGGGWQQVKNREPDDVRKLPRDRFIMFAENLPGEFIEGFRQPYWLMPEFAGKFGIDPYHVRK